MFYMKTRGTEEGRVLCPDGSEAELCVRSGSGGGAGMEAGMRSVSMRQRGRMNI
jgi:hypothetical protein